MTTDELIAALEAATGPSREMDFWCWWHGRSTQAGKGDMPPADYVESRMKEAWTFRPTSSLDAALALVPKHEWLSWSMESGSPGLDDGCFCRVWSEQGEDEERFTPIRVTAKTCALALCIAALRARSAQQ